MKSFCHRILLSAIVAVACSLQVCAQKRLVLIEEFTNTGCGPCASWSPVLDSCINYRLGDCIAIKYHSRYPNPQDEFYTNESTANQARVDYYDVTGVPATFVDGQELGIRSYAYLEQAISYCQQQPAAFAISISKQLEGAHLTAKVALAPAAGLDTETRQALLSPGSLSKLRLYVAAIEEHITSPTPWPNGETELNYTMRKLNEGSIVTPTEQTEWETDLEAFGNLSELGVLAFVQNVETRQILATAYSGPNAEGENRLTLQNLTDTPDLICTPDYYGKVILRNDGANVITSATLNVGVNGAVKQYPWTGSLAYLERDTLAFSDFTGFQLASEGSNSVKVWMSGINGTQAVSNTRTSAFSNSVQAAHAVQLRLYTDKKPEETTWKLYNSAGDVVQEGGPYDGQARKFITVDFDLAQDDCYLLEFLDAGGDGIKGSAGNGYYQLLQKSAEGKTTRIAQGDYDGSAHYLHFRLTDAPQPPHRLVLFEEFTNTSCDPCADFSPAFDEVLYRRLGDMVAITYHYNFPSPQDPFYLASASDVMTRAQFYGVTGVPALRVNGEHVGAWGYETYLDAYIDGAGAMAQKATIDTEASLDGDRLTVDVTVKDVASASADLRLFVAAVEERVEWDTPAANGERAWNYVLRKLLTGAEGQAVEGGRVTPASYTFDWQTDNYADPAELGLVTFLQDMATGEVLATVYTPRPTGSDSAAKILKVLNAPARICSPLFTSDLMVRNTGRSPLTSATLNVSINGSVQQTPWTGRLGYLEVDTLHIPAFTAFTLADGKANEVELWLSALNGTQEESVHKAFTLANAYRAQNQVRLTVMTDNAPEEISWKVFNSAGDVVAEDGPYTEARKKQVADLPLYADDCYTLTFADAGGNGITGDNGRGYFMLHEVSAEGKTRLLVQDTYTTATHSVAFSLQNSLPVGISAPTIATVPGGSAAGVYDLQGRPAAATAKAIISNKRITITNKK